MSTSSVDERVVILEFNNRQFESGVKESLSSIQKLKDGLDFRGASKGLESLQDAGKRFSMSNVVDNIQSITDHFSALGVIGDQVLRRLTNSAINFGKSLITAIPNQIISGGKKRAQNIEQAQFMLKGLLKDAYDWKAIKDDLNYAVSGTAYGLDEAAAAAGQLAASNVQFGEDMKAALRGISGVASMTGDSYTEIAQIFTKIAGQGKVTAQELNQFAAHGVNVAASMANALKEAGAGFGTTEEEIRKMVHEGKVDFELFSHAMDDAFGEHAKNANATFQGVLRNVKASLSRMGEQFATPAYQNLRLILAELLPVLKDIEEAIKPVSRAFEEIAGVISESVVGSLKELHETLAQDNLSVQQGVFGRMAQTVREQAYNLDDSMALLKLRQDYKFSEMYNRIDLAIKDFKTENAILEKLQKEVGVKVEDDQKNIAKTTENVVSAILSESPEKMISRVYKSADEALIDTIKLVEKYVREGEDMSLIADLTVDTIQHISQELGKLTGNYTEMSEEETKSLGLFASYGQAVKETVNDLRLAYQDATLMTYFGGKNPFDSILEDFDKFDERIIEEQENWAKQREAIAESGDEVALAEFDEMHAMPTELETLMQLVRGGYEKFAKVEKKLIASGYDYNKIQQAKQEKLGQYNDRVTETMLSIGAQAEEENKAARIAAFKNAMYEKTAGFLSKIGHGFMQVIGLEKTEEQVNAENLATNEKMKALVDDIIMGKWDNGQKRWDALVKETGVWTVWQNAVNEALGCEKRHEVSLEDEAAMMKYLGIETEEAAEQQTIVNSVFEKLTSIFTGLWSALALVQEVGSALWGEIVLPFLQWAVPRVLDALLTPLAWIGDRLTHIYAVVHEWGVAEHFAAFRESVVEFWKSAKELEGVKKLKAAWDNFKATLQNIWGKATKKVQEGFTNLQQFFKLPEASFFLDIVGNIAEALSNFIDWISGKANVIADFFAPLANWLVDLPPRFAAFWESIGGFEGVKAYFQPLTDWFAGVGESIKEFWKSIFGGKDENGQKVDGLFTPVVAWFEELKAKIGRLWEEAKQFNNVKDLFDWLATKVQNKLTSFWEALTSFQWSSDIFGGLTTTLTDLKDQIIAFVDSVPVLKSVKDFLAGIFDEGFITTITDIAAAIKDFMATVFGKQEGEDGEAPLKTFTERVTEGANNLIARLQEIFSGENFDLGKLLAGGALGFGAIKLITSLFGSKGTGGLGSVVYGSLGGATLPKVTAGILGLVAAMTLFGKSTEQTGEETKQTGGIFQQVFGSLATTFQNVLASIQNGISGTGTAAGSLLDTIMSFLFGNNVATFLAEVRSKLSGIFGGVFDAITSFLFDKDGRLGLGRAGALLAGGLMGVGILNFIRMLGAIIRSILGIGKGALTLLTDFSLAFNAFEKNLRAQTLLTTAKALAIFAGSLVVLSFVPIDRLRDVAGVMAFLILVIGGVMAVFTLINKKSNGLESGVTSTNNAILFFIRNLKEAFRTAATMAGIGILFLGVAAAIGIIVKAIITLSEAQGDVDGAVKTIGGIALILGILFTVLVAIATQANQSIMGAYAMLTVALSLSLMLAVFSKVAMIMKDEGPAMMKAFLLMLGLVGLVFAMSQTVNGKSGASLQGLGSAFLAFSVSLIALAIAVKLFKNMPFEEMTSGAVAFVTAFIALMVLSHGGNGMKEGALSMLTMAAAMILLAPALLLLGYNAEHAFYGIALMLAAVVTFGMAGIILKEGIDVINGITWSILKLAVAALAFSVAFPLFVKGLSVAGEILTAELPNIAWGFGALVIVLLGLAGISRIVKPEILQLGLAMLALGVGIALVIGAVTGFKALKEVFASMAGTFGAMIPMIGKTVNGMKTLSDLIKDLSAGSSGYTTALNRYSVALGKMNFVNESVKTELNTKMEELKHLDGSEYSIYLHGVLTYIEDLDLPEAQTRQLVRTTVEAALLDAQENYTASMQNLKGEIHDLDWKDQASEDEFWELVKRLVNSGIADHSDDPLPLGVNDILVKLEGNPGFESLTEAQKESIKTAVRFGVTAAVGKQVSLGNLYGFIETLDVDPESKTNIQTGVTSYLANETFNGNATVDKLNTILSEDALVKLDPFTRAALLLKVSQAFSSARQYTFALSNLKATIAKDGVNIDQQKFDEEVWPEIIDDINAMAQKKIDEGQSDEDTDSMIELSNLRTKIESLLGRELTEEEWTLIKNNVTDAVNSKGRVDTILNDVYLMLNKEGITASPAIRKKLQDALNEYMANPENIVALKEMYVACLQAKMSEEEMADFFKMLGIYMDDNFEAGIMLHNMEVAFGKVNLDPEAVQEVYTKIAELKELAKNGEIDENSTEYQDTLNLIWQAAGGSEEDFEKAKQYLDETLQQAEDVQTAIFQKMYVHVQHAEFAGGEAERASWLGKVRELLTISTDDSMPLDVAIKEFLLNLTYATLSPDDQKILSDLAAQSLKTYETSFNAQYAETMARIEAKRRYLLGGAGILDKSGVYVMQDTKLQKAIEDYWAGIDLTGASEEDIAKAWEGFSNYLYHLDIGENQILTDMGGYGEEFMALVQDAFVNGLWGGADSTKLMAALGSIIEMFTSGENNEFKYLYRNQGKGDIRPLVEEYAKRQWGEDNQIYGDEYLQGIEAAIDDGLTAMADIKELNDRVTDTLGKARYSDLTLADLYKYVYDETLYPEDVPEYETRTNRLDELKMVFTSDVIALLELLDEDVTEAKEKEKEAEQKLNERQAYINDLWSTYQQTQIEKTVAEEGFNWKKARQLQEQLKKIKKELDYQTYLQNEELYADKPFSLDEFLENYFYIEPVELEQPEKEVEKVEEEFENILEGLDEVQVKFIEDFKNIFNPNNIEDTNEYANWLKAWVDSLGIEHNGEHLDLATLLEEALTYKDPDDPTQLFANILHETLKSGKSLINLPDLFAQYPELIDIDFVKGIDMPGLITLGSEGGWLHLREGEEEIIAQGISDEYLAIMRLAREKRNEEIKNSDDPATAVLEENFNDWLKGNIPTDIFTTIVKDSDSPVASIISGWLDQGLDKDTIAAMGFPSGEALSEGILAGAENKSGEVINLFSNQFPVDIFDGFDDAIKFNSPSKVMIERGEGMMEGLEIGGENAADKPISMMLSVAGRCVEAIESFLGQFADKGSESTYNYANGMEAKSDATYGAAIRITQEAINGAKSKHLDVVEAGKDFGDGYIEGINSKAEEASIAAANLTAGAIGSVATEQDSASPSKVTMRLGNYFGLGYVNGMNQFGAKVHAAASGLAETAIDTLRNPLSIVQSFLDDDLDHDPIIRPVMDLSEIQNGVGAINHLMPSRSISLGVSASAAMAANRKYTNADVIAAIHGAASQNQSVSGNTYNINGITYDDGTNVAEAVQSLVHAARVERRR